MKPSETYHIIEMMKATGNQPGVIERWKALVADWAQKYRTDPNAAAVNAWLPLWQPREVYSAEELAPMWPALAIATGFTNRWPAVVKSARRLEHELLFHGLPHRRIEGRRLFAVQRFHVWAQLPDDVWKREFENVHG
jgi:hypothetical protein